MTLPDPQRDLDMAQRRIARLTAERRLLQLDLAEANRRLDNFERDRAFDLAVQSYNAHEAARKAEAQQSHDAHKAMRKSQAKFYASEIENPADAVPVLTAGGWDVIDA